MPDTIAILAPSEEIVPIEELLELSANENIQRRKSNRRLLGYTITWDDVSLHIDFPEKGIQQRKVADFLATVDDLLNKRRDKKAQKIERRAERMMQYIECRVEPEWDAERKAQLLVQGVMAFFDYALMFANGTVYNENGNVEVGHGESKPKYWAQEIEEDTIAANERKLRSLELLKKEDVPYIHHLRNLPDDEFIHLRSVEEIANRAACLSFISRFADGESKEWLASKLANYGLADELTEQERLFIDNDSPDEYLVIMFSQRIEACNLLLWAMNFVYDLPRPDDFCDSELVYKVIDSRSSEKLIEDTKLRSVSEIMNALDLHFRYHWATTDAELYGRKAPAKLISDVVYQRHFALNWLIQHNGKAWDEVTTDT